MNILELDEAQGLTAEIVRAWMKRNAYRMTVSDSAGEVWDGVRGLPVVLYHDGSELSGAVERIVANECVGIQAVLREINPRLRKGAPSAAARQAHTGHWIAIAPDGAGYLVRFDERRHGGDPGFEMFRSSPRGKQSDPFYDPGCSFCISDFQGGLAEWRFWPVDSAGNKVRWPEKDGVML